MIKIPPITPAIEARFMAKVHVGAPNDCWEWLACCNANGYGVVRTVWGCNVIATRFMWTLTNGPIPDGLYCLHKCDNPRCVNPAHLRLGTRDENIAERNARGRTAQGDTHYSRARPELVSRGASHCRAKLTEEDVQIIRAQRAAGVQGKTLAEQFGVSDQTICDITKGRGWKHVAE